MTSRQVLIAALSILLTVFASATLVFSRGTGEIVGTGGESDGSRLAGFGPDNYEVQPVEGVPLWRLE